MKGIKIYGVVGSAVLGLFLGGCSEPAEDSVAEVPNIAGEMADTYAELGRSLEDARVNLEDSLAKLDAIGVALDGLEDKDLDLRTQYVALNESVAEMEVLVANLQSNRGEVNQACAAALGGWKDGLVGISNKKMREKSADRLKDATKGQKEFDEAIEKGSSMMDAYFATLKDLSKYLDLELSRSSVKSASKAFNSARKSDAEIKKWIGEILREIAEMKEEFTV